MADPLSIPASTNGHGLPVDWQGLPTDTIQRLELAYQEIARRDSQAERRAGRKDRLVCWLLGALLALVAALLWLAYDRQQIKAFVQVVQVEDGKVVQLAVPASLYDYQPPEAVYLEMVAQWVRWVRWRGEDEHMLRAQWAWAYRHTCGVGLKWLKASEEKEKPFKIGTRRVAVEVKSVTKIAAPEAYQVLWEESVTEKNAPTVKTQLWTGTFTTGRMVLKAMEDLLDNRLGLCVSAYELAPQPS